MVGSSILRLLNTTNNVEAITADREQLDLKDQAAVENFFQENKFDEVYLAAAKVGGINANHIYPADFIFDNLMIQANIIHSAFLSGVKKLLFLGSSCIYPRESLQPISEEALLSGYLEKTNEPYAISKIAGIKLCESYNRQYGESLGIDYRSIMPTNLYGPGDNYHINDSHVVPALVRKFHEAKLNNDHSVEVWGSGKPLREFLHVDDMARACLFFMNIDKSKIDKVSSPMCSHFNIGFGSDISISKLAYLVRDIVGFKGKVVFDTNKPDGTMRKLLDSSKANMLGWFPEIELKDGLLSTYEDFKKNTQRGV